jgi:zeta-carotene desaturase
VRVERRLAIDIVDRQGRASRLDCPPLPPPLNLAAGVMRWSALAWRDRLAVLRMRRGRLRTGEAGETVRQWLRRQGQTTRVIEVLWEPLAVAALNQPIDVAAAAPFARVLAGLFGSSRRDAALAIPLKPLDEVYALPSTRFIEQRGGEVRTSAAATIRCQRTHADVDVRGEVISSRAIVCAVPWHGLPELFDPASPLLAAVATNARNTMASPIVTVNLWLDRAVTNGSFIGLPGRTMQWVFDKRTLFGSDASHLSLVSSGAEAVVGQSNEQLVALALEEVRAALPIAATASVRRAVVVREKRATFSVAPGQPPRPGTVTDVPGLFLAGDWIETGLPATIEGAVLSGHRAADAAMGQ